MGYTYETIDGQRVEQNVAAAFRKLAAAFKATFGLTLHVTSGTRTRAEQQALYDAYRAGRGNLAAPPGQSNHEETGPRGPRALDVRDSGGDPGVTSAGTVRSNWLRQNAPAYDFDPAGFRFSQVEPWHIEFTGPLSTGPVATPSATAKPEVMLSWPWTGIQRMLKSDFGYRGAIDNKPGSGTISAFQRFMNAKGYGSLAVDGVWGPATTKAAQTWLARRWGYKGAIDAIPGSGTKAAWTAAEQANDRAYAGIR